MNRVVATLRFLVNFSKGRHALKHLVSTVLTKCSLNRNHTCTLNRNHTRTKTKKVTLLPVLPILAHLSIMQRLNKPVSLAVLGTTYAICRTSLQEYDFVESTGRKFHSYNNLSARYHVPRQ